METKTGHQIGGKEVIDQFGARVGKVDRVMKDPGQDAEWARVKLGRFGVRSAWIPIDQFETTGDSVRVPFGREQVDDAHDIASGDEISLDQQARLHQHFAATPGRADQADARTGTDTTATSTTARDELIRDREDSEVDDRTADAPGVTPMDRATRDDGHTFGRRDPMPDVGTARARQRYEFGGVNWGSAFFGWLVAIGIATIMMSIVAAAGASLGLSESDVTESLSIGGAVTFLVALTIAYFAGGYVAGRMSRFDGARQGAATWTWGLILTLLAAAAGWAIGSEYNILQQLNLPRIPVDEGTLATGAAITLAATALLTLLAAVAGGKVGERYHERVDESAFFDPSYRR